jgi:hypothetical protein
MTSILRSGPPDVIAAETSLAIHGANKSSAEMSSKAKRLPLSMIAVLLHSPASLGGKLRVKAAQDQRIQTEYVYLG